MTRNISETLRDSEAKHILESITEKLRSLDSEHFLDDSLMSSAYNLNPELDSGPLKRKSKVNLQAVSMLGLAITSVIVASLLNPALLIGILILSAFSYQFFNTAKAKQVNRIILCHKKDIIDLYHYWLKEVHTESKNKKKDKIVNFFDSNSANLQCTNPRVLSSCVVYIFNDISHHLGMKSKNA